MTSLAVFGHSFQCWGASRNLAEWEFKCGHRKDLPQGSLDWHNLLKKEQADAARKCEKCAGRPIKEMEKKNMGDKKASGASAFRDAIENKKLAGEKAIQYIAKATGKEFTEAKFVWYSNLYKDGKLGGKPAEALKAKAAKKAK